MTNIVQKDSIREKFIDFAWAGCPRDSNIHVEFLDLEDNQNYYEVLDTREKYLEFCNNSSFKLKFWKYVPRKESPRQKIFVFGSNLRGIHGAGAALTAVQGWNAKIGVGEGITGTSYAFPTKDRNIDSFENVSALVPFRDNFVETAKANPSLTFAMTRIGCGLAGYKEEEVMELFMIPLPKNIELPYFWHKEWEKRFGS